MPYISVKTSVSLNKEQKDAVSAGLGRLISVIPGKSESVLMVDVSGDCALYFRGQDIPCAYLHVALYGAADKGAKKDFAEQACKLLQEVSGVPAQDIYLTYSEKDCWGAGGTLI